MKLPYANRVVVDLRVRKRIPSRFRAPPSGHLGPIFIPRILCVNYTGNSRWACSSKFISLTISVFTNQGYVIPCEVVRLTSEPYDAIFIDHELVRSI